MRRQIQGVLEGIGLVSASARSAAAGLALARRRPPTVILCADRPGEPPQAGHNLARLFREKVERGREALILMISGQRNRWKGHEQPGVDGFLRLPLDERALATVVRAYLARRPLLLNGLATPHAARKPEDADTMARRLVSMAQKCWKNNSMGAVSRPLGEGREEKPFVHAGQVDGLAREMARFHGREADLHCHVENGFLPLEKDELASIVGELVENACRYSPPGSPIKVFAVRGEGYAELCVRDYGYGGISPSETSPQGLGLGLTLAKILVESRDGSFQIHHFPRSGTLVRIELPLRKGREA